MIDRSPLSDVMYCVICNGFCRPPAIDCDASGPPCTPWAATGLRRGHEDPVVVVHLTWFLHSMMTSLDY